MKIPQNVDPEVWALIPFEIRRELWKLAPWKLPNQPAVIEAKRELFMLWSGQVLPKRWLIDPNSNY